MGKKIIETGAPAYMALYTSLMTLLLAFFILLNTMSQTQEAGFNVGIGDVKDAFGLQGGLGLFQFTFAGRGAANPISLSNPTQTNEKESGFSKDMVRKDGGTGNTDLKSEKADQGEYLRLTVPFKFSKFSSKIPRDMADYLEKVGIGLALFDYAITIRCYANEISAKDVKNGYASPRNAAEMNIALASKRAVQIMRYLHMEANIPFDNMTALGYDSDRLLQLTDKGQSVDGKQGTFFYIFLDSNKAKRKHVKR